MNKLKKLFDNQADEQFVQKLEAKLLEKYDKKRTPFFSTWRFSLAGVSLVLLVALTAFFVQPLGMRDNLIARAGEAYHSLENEEGVFYQKIKVTSKHSDPGLSLYYGDEYVQETWLADNGDYLTKIEGSEASETNLKLKQIEGPYRTYLEEYTNDSMLIEDFSFQDKYPTCILLDELRGKYVGTTTLNQMNNDGVVEYSVWSNFYGYEGDVDLGGEPDEDSNKSYNWISNGYINESDLTEAFENDRYKVEEVFWQEVPVYKISFGNAEYSQEYYFDKESLVLKANIYQSVLVRHQTEYLVMENLKDADHLFDPSFHNLTRISYQPLIDGVPETSDVGCYGVDGLKMSSADEAKFMAKLPEDVKVKVEKEKALASRWIDELNRCEGDWSCVDGGKNYYADPNYYESL